MAIMTWTRERRCKDCMNLRSFRPNPEKYYRRHKCIVKDQNRSPKDKDAARCVDFDWNYIGVPYDIDYKPENK